MSKATSTGSATIPQRAMVCAIRRAAPTTNLVTTAQTLGLNGA